MRALIKTADHAFAGGANMTPAEQERIVNALDKALEGDEKK